MVFASVCTLAVVRFLYMFSRYWGAPSRSRLSSSDSEMMVGSGPVSRLARGRLAFSGPDRLWNLLKLFHMTLACSVSSCLLSEGAFSDSSRGSWSVCMLYNSTRKRLVQLKTLCIAIFSVHEGRSRDCLSLASSVLQVVRLDLCSALNTLQAAYRTVALRKSGWSGRSVWHL